MPRSGQLRHVVSIQRNTRARDANGEYTDAWTDVWAGERAHVEYGAGKTNDRPDENLAETAVSVIMRRRMGIDATMRVSWLDFESGSVQRYFAIEAVLPVDLQWMELACREINGGQQRAQ